MYNEDSPKIDMVEIDYLDKSIEYYKDYNFSAE
jgi:hypothetical protein